MNNNKPYPLALMSEFGISWITVIGIAIWVFIAKKKDGVKGVRRVGMICGMGGIALGSMNGFSPHLATCAGMGIILHVFSYALPTPPQQKDAKTDKK